MSNPKVYTVGWICAISTEYVAARAFLDEKHEEPEFVSPNDNNDYTLGRVSKHNVVIAVLPDGEYGTSSAASVARDMLHSFPNVRIGLMVGIGGGSPSPKHDIRLGDIVVSAPRDGKGGVFQYDFGKTIQDQTFRPTGFLNQPPMILRTAVAGLKAQYESEGHQLEETVKSILEKKPRLRKKYQRLDPSSDRLYQTRVVHPNDEASCVTVCGDDPSNLILRPERTEDEDNPTIHYGLIASANQLMKDALIRDRLATEKDILYFEMEAAGLMNHFPCLVIRGICDYSDSHKNKKWQGYAAMAAAAYAKDLLCRIPPNKVEAEKRIGDILSGIHEGVNKLLRRQHDHDHETILEWLTLIDYAPQQSDFINRRQEGTGEWLLNSNEFKNWVNQSNQTLFCPGIPGAGKTIITSIVVDDLYAKFQNDTNIGIAYIYCNFRRQQEQEAVDLLASLLKQLVQEQTFIPERVKSLYERHKDKRTRPSFDEVSKALHSIVADYSRVFIIIDALDECQASDGGRKRFLAELFDLQARTGASLFATSRFIPETVKEFEGRSTQLKIRASDDDLQRYLNGHILKLPSFVTRSVDLQEEVKTVIINAVDGMFLLAQLHLDSLIGMRSPKATKTALRKLPKGSEAYNDAYEEAMERVEGQNPNSRELAKQVLSWITCAKRPLTTFELRHAFAVEIGESQLDEENLSEVEDIVSVCAGLVTVDEESDIIRLVHYTTQEYFERTQRDWFPDGETHTAEACITYLSFDIFETGFCPTDKEFEARLRLNPLYDYAARNWGYHARATSTEVEQLVLGFLESEAKVAASSQAMMALRSYSVSASSQVMIYSILQTLMTGVHLAAYFGLVETMATLLKNGHDPEVKDSGGRTPLSWAAEKGHEAVVQLLLTKDGVDPDSKDNYGGTPLSWGAENGHETVVKLLLAEDCVDPDSKGEDGRTPLSRVARNGHEMVVKLLLATDGVDPDSKGDDGRTPLSYAAGNGHDTVVKLLLEKVNVDANSKSNNGQTPLSWAAKRGHKAVIKLLLASDGVDPDSKNSDGWTPLSWAAENGHEAVVKLLLAKNGVDPDSKDNNGQTPLLWALENGHEIVERLLIEKGAATPMDYYGLQALFLGE